MTWNKLVHLIYPDPPIIYLGRLPYTIRISYITKMETDVLF